MIFCEGEYRAGCGSGGRAEAERRRKMGRVRSLVWGTKKSEIKEKTHIDALVEVLLEDI